MEMTRARTAVDELDGDRFLDDVTVSGGHVAVVQENEVCVTGTTR